MVLALISDENNVSEEDIARVSGVIILACSKYTYIDVCCPESLSIRVLCQVKRDIFRSVLLGLKHLHQRKRYSDSLALALNAFIVATLDGTQSEAPEYG